MGARRRARKARQAPAKTYKIKKIAARIADEDTEYQTAKIQYTRWSARSRRRWRLLLGQLFGHFQQSKDNCLFPLVVDLFGLLFGESRPEQNITWHIGANVRISSHTTQTYKNTS